MATDNPADSRAGTIIGVVIALCTLSSICVALRFYARMHIRKNVGIDDWMTLAALVLEVLCGGGMCLMTRYGHGRHISTLSKQEFETYLEVFYFDIIFYLCCLGVVKTAILMQYLRIFTTRMRKVTVWATVIIGMWSVALVIIQIFTCTPIEGFWKVDIEKKCIPNLPSWYINAAGNILSDLFIFLLPIPVLWKLHLPLGQRLSLVAVFALGLFTCTISLIRIPFLSLGDDITYNNVIIASWTMAELSCAIIGSCLPTLRPLLFKVFPRLDPSSRDPYGSGGPSDVNSKGNSSRVHATYIGRPAPADSSTEILAMADYEQVVGSDGAVNQLHSEGASPAPSVVGLKDAKADMGSGAGAHVSGQTSRVRMPEKRVKDPKLGTTTAIRASQPARMRNEDGAYTDGIVVQTETSIH